MSALVCVFVLVIKIDVRFLFKFKVLHIICGDFLFLSY